ncbi:SEC-C domain-containing protein [Candidatus Lokiarchaeum ossiferum]|uniref:SEC-C domain-containing protein n=1 Tax=Candidatus Lokiarchaeum ossiferum TaxID=2951803 RepID=UPI00352F341D
MNEELIPFITKLKTKDFPFEDNEEIKTIFKEIRELKQIFVNKDDQNGAKDCWIVETIINNRIRYENAWISLTQRKYEKAWRELVFCEKWFEYLLPHFNYMDEDYSDLFLDEIEERTKTLMSLFPYYLFFSPSYVIKKLVCSICNEEINPFNRCDHKLREIYNGEICFRIIEEIKEINHLALTRFPRWKLRYFKPDNVNFNYDILSILIDRSENSMDGWNVIADKLGLSHENFKHFQPDHYCPCGSFKSYKECCMKNDSVYINAYRIDTNSKRNNNHFISMRFRQIKVEEEEKIQHGSSVIVDPEAFYFD